MRYLKIILLLGTLFLSFSRAEILSEDTFTNGSLDGWQGDGSTQYVGWMDIDKDQTAYKTYDFGSTYANTTVSIAFGFYAPDAWESTGDVLELYINDVKQISYNNGGGYQTLSFATQTDQDGKIKVSFRPNTNSNDEWAAFNYINIYTGSVTPGYRDFTLRKSFIERGNMVTIGNTVLVAPDTGNGTGTNQNICATYTNGPYIDNATSRNNFYYLCHYFSDPSRPSTSATIDTQMPDPNNSELVWAGLYWQALTDLSENALTSMQIRIKNNDSDYVTIGFDQLDYAPYIETNFGGNNSTFSFAAFKDITQVLQDNHWLDGTYTVADIPAVEGMINGLGTYGAWTMVLIYRNPDEKYRTFSVFDGYQNIDGTNDVNIDINGFYTTKTTPISSTASIFVGEGDRHITGDHLYAQPYKKTSETMLTNDPSADKQAVWSVIDPDFTRTPSPANNQGIDIQAFQLGTDGYDIMEPGETGINFRFTTDGDVYWPSMIAFNTELYTPALCYDYAYKQNDRYFTEENDGSKEPYISGNLFSNSPIDVSLFIRNNENSDIVIKNMKLNIDPIDTAQATYINGSAQIIPYGAITRTSTTVDSSADGFIRGMYLGDIGSKEYIYAYYDLDPQTYQINMPLNASIDFNTSITLPDGTIFEAPNHLRLGQEVPLCVDGNFSYAPIYGTFNVEQPDIAGDGNYNIFTQVARRVENFQVKSYNPDNPDEPADVSTIVAVELIDAGAYHETQTSCQEPDSALTPRVWVVFDNNVSQVDFNAAVIQAAIDAGLVSDQIIGTSPLGEIMDESEDYFSVIRRNTAFRISYVDMGDGESPLLDKNINQGNSGGDTYTINNWRTEWSGEDCAVDMVTNGNGDDNRVASYCNDTGNNPNELATCMECVYGKSVRYICSRDNFAIRPEAFKVSLTDDNTTVLNADFANNTDKSGTVSSPIHLVAGYPYRIDINATSNTDENPVRGYTQLFDSSTLLKRAYMKWNPSTTVDCNEPVDRNMSFALVNGTNTNNNPINTWEDRHDTLTNVGEYAFIVVDEEWTKYDWDNTLTQHHDSSTGHFLTEPDCLKEDPQNSSVPSIGNRVGCATSSIHSASYATYNTLNIQSHPYAFDVSNLNIGARPTNDTANSTFVYMNTLDELNNYPDGYADRADENMSYNIQGTFTAVDHNVTGGFQPLSNYVSGCYAEDINMHLLYRYLPMTPADTLALRYDLIDYNTTDSSIVYRSRETGLLDTSTNIVEQGKAYFVKDMKGSITMDLGYNEPRTFNVPKNPVYVSMDDFNITLKSQPSTLFVDGTNTHKVYGNVNIDQNVTFIYGRAKSTKFFYDNITANALQTPVSVVAFCNLGLTECQNRGLVSIAAGLLEDAQSNEVNWWYVQTHNTNSDGSITLSATGGSVNPADPTPLNLVNGIDNTVIVTNSGGTTPNIVDINFGNATDRWLIYNKDANTLPLPFYRVRFINAGNWSTTGNLPGVGHVIGGDINSQKANRVEW